MSLAYRALGAGDLEHVKWALYEAVSWGPARQLPPFEVTIEHPELARYHRGWGRPGGAGVAAEADGTVVGVGFYRLFTEDDHGHGYVDPETPELAVAVGPEYRRAGIGTRLMPELAETARRSGMSQLSLSVDGENPALRLYERLGYVALSRDESGVRMLLRL